MRAWGRGCVQDGAWGRVGGMGQENGTDLERLWAGASGWNPKLRERYLYIKGELEKEEDSGWSAGDRGVLRNDKKHGA